MHGLQVTTSSRRARQLTRLEVNACSSWNLRNGTVRIEHNGAVLAARAFPKDARVHHGAIVENKVLAGAPEAIQVKQHERDEKLKRFRRTLREKDQFQRTLEPAVREKDKPPTVAPHALLGGALAWAQEFARHESARRSS